MVLSFLSSSITYLQNTNFMPERFVEIIKLEMTYSCGYQVVTLET